MPDLAFRSGHRKEWPFCPTATWLRALRPLPGYSITSSARAISDCGTVRPSALAVFRLMTSSNLGRLLDWQIGGLGALEDLSGIYADFARHPP